MSTVGDTAADYHRHAEAGFKEHKLKGTGQIHWTFGPKYTNVQLPCKTTKLMNFQDFCFTCIYI